MLDGVKKVVVKELDTQVSEDIVVVPGIVEEPDTQMIEHKQTEVTLPPATSATTLPEEKSDTELVFSHNKVACIAGGGFMVGGKIGEILGELFAPKIAQAAGDAVYRIIDEKGEQLVSEALKDAGLEGVPGLGGLLNNQVADFAEKSRRVMYDQTKEEIKSKGMIIGGTLGSVGTIAVMEGINLGAHLYSNYVTPYLETRRRKSEQRKLQAAMPTPAIDYPVVEDDEGLGFVLVPKA